MKIKFDKDFFIHPGTIFFGVLVGVVIGLTSTRLPPYLATLGGIYLALLQMCILPIVITAITSSLGHLLHSESVSIYLRRLLLVFLFSLLIAAVLGIFVGVVINPGHGISETSRVALGQQVANLQSAFNVPTDTTTNPSLSNTLTQLVPINIFYAIDQGQSLSILFFFVLLGIALGSLRNEKAKQTLTVIDTLYTALFKIVTWIMYGLPFGLCFLFAGYVGHLSFSIVVVLIKLILAIFVALLILTIIYTLMMAWYFRGQFLQMLQFLKAPWIIAFGTSSSLATLPAMLKTVHTDLKINKYLSELVLPLGVHLNLPGSVIVFLLGGIFMTGLYGHALSAGSLTLMAVTAILAAIAAPGVPGLVSMGLFALILQPLGLPVVVGIILLSTIDPIIDPLVTLINVYSNIVAAVVIAAPSMTNCKTKLSHPIRGESADPSIDRQS